MNYELYDSEWTEPLDTTERAARVAAGWHIAYIGQGRIFWQRARQIATRAPETPERDDCNEYAADMQLAETWRRTMLAKWRVEDGEAVRK